MARPLFRLASPIFLESPADMTLGEQTLCDDLFGVLGHHNGEPMWATNEAREQLWRDVFFNWNTNCMNYKPAPMGGRRLHSTAEQAGVLFKDCPPPHSIPLAQRETYTPPATRREGQPVWIKPSLGRQENSVSYIWVDGSNRQVPNENVKLLPGYTLGKAIGAAINKWDQEEITRVGEWNKRMIVYWARNRLALRLQNNVGDRTIDEMERLRNPMGVDVPEMKVLPEEILDELVEVHRCKQVLEQQYDTIVEARRQMAILGGERIPKFA